MKIPMRLSPLHDRLAMLDPQWSHLHGMPVALQVRNGETGQEPLPSLALCDLSALPRLEIRGRESATWLAACGIAVPEPIFAARRDPDTGILVARTGSHNVFLEEVPGGCTIQHLREAMGDRSTRRFPVDRQDASLCLCGAQALEALRQSCGFDFEQTGPQLVMTRIAGISAMILREDAHGLPTFRIWTDPSYGPYLWDAMLDIVRTLGGDAIGLAALFPNVVDITTEAQRSAS